MDYNSSDTDSDDVFMGPITKREIVARLKYYKILTEDHLEPLNDLKKTDVVDEDLVAFYWNIFTSRENMACSENPDRNKSIYQDLEQRKTLYNAETSEEHVSIRRDNTPADSFQIKTSEDQNESFNDSLNKNRDLLPKLDCSGLLKMSSSNHVHDLSSSYHEVSNCSIDEQNNDISVITISDDSCVSYEMEYKTLEEIQIKLEDITYDEIEIEDVEKQMSNSLKIDIIPQVEEQNIKQNAKPVEMSILSDTFITKNSDLENYCPSPSFHEQQDDSFNDTLEEMEMLMKFGENYMKQKQDTGYRNSVTSSSQSNISEEFTETEEIYEKISKQQTNLHLNSSKTLNEPHTPIRKEQKSELKTTTPLPKTPSVLKPDNSINTHFKIPAKMAFTRKSPNYKSIVSPISLYIKNSPKVPLIKKVTTPTIHSATYRELDSKNSCEKIQEKINPSHPVLPIRTYKLAGKNIFLSKENEPQMPNNIRKLIKGPLNPEIIKHVGRVKASPDLAASPSTIFSNNEDLTILSSTSASEGIFNISTTSEGDVSIYVSKNAARTNFSTKK